MIALRPGLLIDEEAVARFCRERGIVRLRVFGSVLRDDFDPDRSDIDVLVELPEKTGVGLAYFGWGDELGALLGRRVDLCSRLDPRVAGRVEREARTIYEQA